jgi:hypothetical protein
MPANTFTNFEGYGLFVLLVAPSAFASNLNKQIKADGATIATVNAYFLNTLSGAPYNLGGKINITKFQALWTDVFGDLALQLDQSPVDVLGALTPSVPYTDPPCPIDADQQLIWAQMHK